MLSRNTHALNWNYCKTGVTVVKSGIHSAIEEQRSVVLQPISSNAYHLYSYFICINIYLYLKLLP